MAEERNPVEREWEYGETELNERLGTPTADVRQVIGDDAQVGGEPRNEEGLVERDDADGYVGPDGRMAPHQGPLDVRPRQDPELDAPELDAAERQEIEDVRGIWEGR